MSLTSHGNITTQNVESARLKTLYYGPKRVNLSLHVKDILNRLGAVWTIDAGTLMGAWRDNGKMLSHDDDFDFIVHAPGVDNSSLMKNRDCFLFLSCLKKYFDEYLPNPYRCRIVDSYCKKLEIYDPSHGNYPFHPFPNIDTDYHNVTCDVMLILSDRFDPWNLYVQHDKLCHTKIHVNHFFSQDDETQPPIFYEGHIYNSPNDPENYLKSIYGYIGHNAIYDPKTRFYVSS